MKRNHYPLILVLVCAWQCQNSTTGQKDPDQSIVRDLPPDGMEPGSLFASLKLIRDSLRLDTLENGFDSLEIRIWLSYSFTLRQQLVVIKSQRGTTTGCFYDFEPQLNSSGDSLDSFRITRVPKYPNSSLSYFLDTLYVYRILTLPGYEKSEKYLDSTHPNEMTVEVATKNKYRLYQYPIPTYQLSGDARTIKDILKLITNEFNIPPVTPKIPGRL